jgi:hypothetical protein
LGHQTLLLRGKTPKLVSKLAIARKFPSLDVFEVFGLDFGEKLDVVRVQVV